MYTGYLEDTSRIIAVLATRNLHASEDDAISIWSRYSDTMAAGWLGLPTDDDELYSIVSKYFPEEAPKYPEEVATLMDVAQRHNRPISHQDAETIWDIHVHSSIEGWSYSPTTDSGLLTIIDTYIPTIQRRC